MYINKQQFFRCIILMLMVSFTLDLTGQEVNLSESLDQESAQREEIQRYFGYENVLFRYFTIPYDISTNVNQQGRYVDIGFALFSLLPLVLLLLAYKNKKWFYGLMLLLVFYLFMCFHYSFIMNSDRSRYNSQTGDGTASMINADMSQLILDAIYSFGGVIANPIVKVLDSVTGAKDHITYPIISIFFIVVVWLMMRHKGLSDRFKVVFLIGAIFALLWWLLSGGIIWYGYTMIPLGYGIIMYSIYKPRLSVSPASYKILKSISFAILGLWVFSAYTSRISNIQFLIGPPDQYTGQSIIDNRTIPFTVGMIGEKQALNQLAANLAIAIDKMNADDALILQCGSSLQFDIDSNQYRIFEDNNLSYFFAIANQYKTPSGVVNYYKSVGIKYIILDLKLHTLDRTPERSLTKKYSAMLRVLQNNPSIQLVATDQLVNYSTPGGTTSPGMGVFADPNVPQSQAFRRIGSYAVFEII